MNRYIFKYTALTGILLLLISCERFSGPDLPDETLILNQWIWEEMNSWYLWEQYIPGLDPETETDPEAFFYKLLYQDDVYSWIVDDYDALVAMFDGVEVSTGLSVQPYLGSGDRIIFAVEYVTPESPASDSGIERGDMIIAIDGQMLNMDNYYDLYTQTTTNLEFGEWTGDDVVPNGKKVKLTAVQLNKNPVVHSEVIEYGGKKIGYLVYTQFTNGRNNEWRNELNSVFEQFMKVNISDLVIDLRYNSGGDLDLSAYIASTLGPASAMNNNMVYINVVWNDLWNTLWKEYDLDEDGDPDGEESEQLVIRLPESELNLNLSTLYFLTTDRTASASESLMIGLYPYAEVVQIGENTYGKCFGSITIDDWAEPKRHNWAMQPIVLRYSNAEGFTDFVSGLEPDFVVEENLLDLKPFGSLQDPLLAKALEEITGILPETKKAAAIEKEVPGALQDFRPLPEPPNRMVERMIELPVESNPMK